MKESRKDRRVCSAVRGCIEALEARCLLSATLSNPVPNQSLSSGTAGTPINLLTYFNDPTITGTAVLMQTPAGNIPLVLTNTATPNTVQNFLNYISGGEYASTIIHRSVPGFVLQGGGYGTDGTHITSLGAIAGESSTETLKNTTGTIAMALSSGPDSATSEWFINLGTNSQLDGTSDGGPFTVFGQVIYNGMNVASAIASLPIVNDSTQSGAWNTLPVLSGTNGATVSSEPANNMVTNDTIVVPGGLTFTVQSSNPSLVTGSIDSTTDKLTLTPVGNGTGSSKITVTATDLGGGTTSTSFNVSVGSNSPNVTIGAGGAKKLTYTDADGSTAVIALNGPGSAVVNFAGSNFSQVPSGKNVTLDGTGLTINSIATTATTSASSIVLTTHGGTGAINVAGLTTQSLHAFTGKGADLTGNVNISGSIGALTVGSATGGTISGLAIGTISSVGSFNDTLTLTNAAVSLNKFTAGSITGGTWGLSGVVNNVTAGAISGWNAGFNVLKALSVTKGDLSASISASLIGTITVKGDISGSSIGVTGGGTAIKTINVSGSITGAHIDSTVGNISSVAASSLINSQVYAGFSLAALLPSTTSDFTSSATIGSVKLKTSAADAFSNSDIAAANIGTLALGLIATSNTTTPTGVGAEAIKSLSGIANVKFNLKKLNASSNVQSILSSEGINLGDVVVTLL